MLLLVSGSTRTVGELSLKWPNHLGHLVTPSNRSSIGSLLKTGLFWAVDNGAFSGLDPVRFRRLLRRVAQHSRCLFIVCPDVVGDAKETLRLFDEWEEEVRATGQPVAFVGQDGAENLDLPWDRFECFFVGGRKPERGREWKLSRAASDLCHEAKRRGKWVHVGRVNSLRRMRAVFEGNMADSVDGSSASMFGDTYIRKYLEWIAGIKRESKELRGGLFP